MANDDEAWKCPSAHNLTVLNAGFTRVFPIPIDHIFADLLLKLDTLERLRSNGLETLNRIRSFSGRTTESHDADTGR